MEGIIRGSAVWYEGTFYENDEDKKSRVNGKPYYQLHVLERQSESAPLHRVIKVKGDFSGVASGFDGQVVEVLVDLRNKFGGNGQEFHFLRGKLAGPAK